MKASGDCQNPQYLASPVALAIRVVSRPDHEREEPIGRWAKKRRAARGSSLGGPDGPNRGRSRPRLRYQLADGKCDPWPSSANRQRIGVEPMLPPWPKRHTGLETAQRARLNIALAEQTL
jgi:hypothetical protein